MRRFTFVICLISVFTILARPPGHQVQPGVKHFVSKYCYDCHNVDKEKGGVRLDNLSDMINNNGTAQVWQDILDVLNTGDMPPEKAKAKPAVDELSSVIGNLTEDLLKAKKILTDQGGEIVIRRLNKLEYINSIKALTGIALPDRLVPDDNDEGFNTMGANQYFSPSLIDRYMELGQIAVSKILMEGSAPEARNKLARRGNIQDHINNRLRKLIDDRTAKYEKALLVMNEGHDYKQYDFADKQEARHAVQNYNGITTLQKHYLEHEPIKTGFLLMHRAHEKESLATKSDFRGKYILRMKVATEEGMPEARKYMEVSQNDKLVGYYYIHGTLENPQNLEIEVSPEIDIDRLQFTIKEKDNNRLPRTYYQGKLTKRVNSGEFIPSIWVTDMEVAGPFYDGSYLKKHNEILNGANLETATDSEIIELFKIFAQKAFRSAPVTDSYLQGLLSVHKQEQQFRKSKKEALIKPLAVVLSSPEFLFLGEEKGEGEKKTQLSGREMASRLSYMLWKEAPSQKLLFYGDDMIKDKSILYSQIDGMMNDRRFNTFVEEFFGQWLHLKKFEHLAFDPKKYPDFDQGLILSAKNEVYEFIYAVIKEDLSLSHLIESDFTMVNSMMADYYGFPVNGMGDNYKKVILPANQRYRGGLLGKVAIQAMGSTGDRTSPVERGAFILRKFLNSPPPPPPPNVPQLDSKNNKLTVSEMLDKHNEIPQCYSCHRKMDPLGLAMENFDTVGRWKELKGKRHAQLAGLMPDGSKFADFDGMRQELLKRQDKMIESMIESLIKYGLGREQEFSDQDFVQELMTVAKANDYRFKPLLKAFITSKQFTHK